jgi:methylmalonyl-CoA epimerase
MITGVHHVGYVVPELEPAVRVCVEKLGLSVTKQVTIAEQGIEVVVFRLGPDYSSGIELIKPIRERGPYWEFLQSTGGAGGLHHVAYATDRPLTDEATHLQAQGVALAASTPDGPVHSPAGWRIVNVDPSHTLGLLVQLGEG